MNPIKTILIHVTGDLNTSTRLLDGSSGSAGVCLSQPNANDTPVDKDFCSWPQSISWLLWHLPARPWRGTIGGTLIQMAERKGNTRPKESKRLCTDISSYQKSRRELEAELCRGKRNTKSTCQLILSYTAWQAQLPKRRTIAERRQC